VGNLVCVCVRVYVHVCVCTGIWCVCVHGYMVRVCVRVYVHVPLKLEMDRAADVVCTKLAMDTVAHLFKM